MKKLLLVILISLYIGVYCQSTDSSCQPVGIKLSLGDNFDKSTQYDKQKLLQAQRHDYTITYSTKANCPDNYCEIYSTYNKSVKFTVKPIIKKFTQAKDTTGFASTQTRTQDFEQYVYEYQLDAQVLKFIPDTIISYNCFYQSDDTPKVLKDRGVFEFYHPDYSQLNQREFKFAWIADFDINPSKIDKFNKRQFGKDNMQLMDKYIKQDRKNYVAIIGGGDYAYDLMDDSGERGINFLKAGESSYATIPFVTIAGNHEEWYDWSYYKSFFRNPRSSISESDYYTLTFGELLLVGLNTNRYIKDPITNKNVEIDKPFLAKILKWFDDTMNEMKGKYRWVVVYSHQNIYCFEDYPTGACYTNPTIFAELEDLMFKHKVDLYLAGHVHAYERMHPNYKGEIKFKETDQCQMNKCSIYNQPQAPVYVIDGTGGTNHYFPKDSGYPGGKLTVTSDRTLGFSTVTVKNSTHLVFEHILSDNNFQVFDTFTIYKPLPQQPGQSKGTDEQNNIKAASDDSSESEEEHKKMYIVFFVILGFVVAGNIVLFIWFKNRLLQQKQKSKIAISQSEPEAGAITANQL